MPKTRVPKGAKILHGSFRPSRENPNEIDPKPLAKIPAPPRHMSELAKKEWQRVIHWLVENKILGDEGLAYLETYCELYALIRSTPMLHMPAAYLAQFKTYAKSLCLTPDGRASWKAPPVYGDKGKEGEKKNPFTAFKK